MLIGSIVQVVDRDPEGPNVIISTGAGEERWLCLNQILTTDVGSRIRKGMRNDPVMIDPIRGSSSRAEGRSRAPHDEEEEEHDDGQDRDDDDAIILAPGSHVPVIAGAVKIGGVAIHVTVAVIAAIIVRAFQAADFSREQWMR